MTGVQTCALPICGKGRTFRNTAIIFLLSGFWHGANWTFVCWGAYHALLFAPLMFLGKNRNFREIVARDRKLPTVGETVQMLTTFLLVAFGWIIFRANTIGDAWGYIGRLFSKSLLSKPILIGEENTIALVDRKSTRLNSSHPSSSRMPSSA